MTLFAMSRNTANEADAEIDRLKRELNVELDRELAEELGLDPSTVAGWRRRGSVPERYRMRVLRMADQSAGRATKLSSAISLREAYIFALIRHAVFAYPDAGFGLANYEATYFGFRLANLHYYLKRRFGLEADPDKLRALYEGLLREVEEADIPVWLETIGS
ncbi:helix-turn-helix domain-containing protein [Methylorubrum suomiense]|uniref:helix-turn-helix domain-containing protein n=1 Tax=Methylorubrum suomiense TaxID=144191 RepID=UPI001EE22BC7|nr:helix-turn-helix domain-containing protein [Methylorubrum suomiense]